MLGAEPALPAVVLAGIERGDRRGPRAAAWALLDVGAQAGAGAAARELQDGEAVTVTLEHGARSDLQVRCTLTRWGGSERVDLRTWFRGRDGRWRPTRRGTTVPASQLEALETAVRMLREAYMAGALEHVRNPPTPPDGC